jgi:hypothetical protein
MHVGTSINGMALTQAQVRVYLIGATRACARVNYPGAVLF